jgi:hypothetical protein
MGAKTCAAGLMCVREEGGACWGVEYQGTSGTGFNK